MKGTELDCSYSEVTLLPTLILIVTIFYDVSVFPENKGMKKDHVTNRFTSGTWSS